MVTSFRQGRIQLTDALGSHVLLSPLALVSDPDAGLLNARSRPDAPTPPVLARDARLWERHLTEVITGLPSDATPGQLPKPAYDLAVTTLAQREAAKAAELAALGIEGASARTVRRKRQHYQKAGQAALADRRTHRSTRPGSRVDPRVMECLNLALSQAHARESAASIRRRTASLLGQLHPGATPLPSPSTFRRLIAAHGSRHTPGRVRRTLGPPGAAVAVDTFALPGTRSLDLTLALDTATGCVCAALVHLRGAAPDPVALFARWCAPAPLSLASRQGKPVWRLTAGVDTPVIRPRRLVLQPHAGARVFAERFARLGIDTEFPRATQFQNAAADMNALARRLGRHLSRTLPPPGAARERAVQDPVTVAQAAVDAWVAEVWHDSPRLSATAHPVTPAAQYAHLVAQHGAIDLPLDAAEYLDLMPLHRRRIGRDGIRLHKRRYDSHDLDPYRGQGQHVLINVDVRDPNSIWLHTASGARIPVPAADGAATLDRLLAPAYVSAAVDRALLAGRGQPALLPPAEPRERPGPRPLDTPQGWRHYLESPLPVRDGTDRLAYHAQLTLSLPLVEDVERALRRQLAFSQYQMGTRRVITVCGPPSSGKTTAVLLAARHHHLEHGATRPTDSLRTSSIYVTARPRPTTRALLHDLARSLALPGSARTTHALADQVSAALSAGGIDIVIIDDGHHLLHAASAATGALEALRYLAARVPVTFVITATADPDHTPVLLDGWLDRVHAAPLGHGPAWHALLTGLDAALWLRNHRTGRIHAFSRLLYQASGALPARAVSIVRAAAVDAVIDGTEEITEQALMRHTRWPALGRQEPYPIGDLQP
ncbi:AAA family ATPase [Kitasatospora sp. NPDC057965]|uniref:AAA family ATPase n=1 Tax=Kitasatospora sp. NPDC057965 TaxID=3346291 RepID=UPI0036DF8C02